MRGYIGGVARVLTQLDAGPEGGERAVPAPGRRDVAPREAHAHGVHAVHEHVVYVSGGTCLQREQRDIVVKFGYSYYISFTDYFIHSFMFLLNIKLSQES